MTIYPLLERYLLLLPCLLGWATAATASGQPLLQTVDQVNLDRYVGTWYEVARLPNRFQDHCSGDVTADYRRLDDGTVEVVNRCLDRHGVMDEARGVARIVDTSSNAKLEVSFVALFGWHLFWGDYWILGLGRDYEYAVIGEPDRDYGWVLSRTARLPEAGWDQVRRVLTSNGYDPDRFLRTRHGAMPSSD